MSYNREQDAEILPETRVTGANANPYYTGMHPYSGGLLSSMHPTGDAEIMRPKLERILFAAEPGINPKSKKEIELQQRR